MAENNLKQKTEQHKETPDNSSSDEGLVNPRLHTTVEEREYGTIPGSALLHRLHLVTLELRQIQPLRENLQMLYVSRNYPKKKLETKKLKPQRRTKAKSGL